MENFTLEAEAFATQFEDLTPAEILEACAGKLSSFNICEKAENWKAYVRARYGRKYIAGRPDIVTTRQLIDHARAIENEVEAC